MCCAVFVPLPLPNPNDGAQQQPKHKPFGEPEFLAQRKPYEREPDAPANTEESVDESVSEFGISVYCAQ